MISIVAKRLRPTAVRHFVPTVTSFSTETLAGLTAEQINKIAETNRKLRSRHVEIEATLNPSDRDLARRKRMIYRSKQRGWLEADILMGSWAVKNVPSLTSNELDEYDIILNEETIDVFNYITGKDPLPDHLKGLPLMLRLQKYALEEKIATPDDYETIKKEANLT